MLEPNLPATFYRGAGRIGRLRGTDLGGDLEARPEDWVGSTTARFGLGTAGMTRLANGSLLADVIAADPVSWLGAEHVARHGADPALLVKLLDAGQRLPLHAHPDRGFAASHLTSPYGKTEAWIVLEAAAGAAVHLGFTRSIEADELARWVRAQDVEAMLGMTNRVPVAAGDTLLCPAGMPHAIGEGILLVELQEPSDFSVLLEWRGFPLGPDDATLGLSLDQALACVDRQACTPERLDGLRGRSLEFTVGSLLPEAADPFFLAERIDSRVSADISPGFGLLVATSGSGVLATESGASVAIERGSTVLIPFAAGSCRVNGSVAGIRCLPAAERRLTRR
jgi:mannose-6-phosphate isomerase